jgi:hypothetical protein
MSRLQTPGVFDFHLKSSAWLVTGGLFLFGLAMASLGVKSLYNDLDLGEAHAVIDAVVTDTRVDFSAKTGISYDVKYEFALPGSAERFTRADETGRKDLWSSVTAEQWARLERDKKLSVRYHPSNPWINRPVETGAAPVWDALTMIVLLGAGPLAMSLLIFWAIRKERAELHAMRLEGRRPDKPQDYHVFRDDPSMYPLR